MDVILDALFQCDLDIFQSEDDKRQSSAALNDVLQAERAAKGELSPEQWIMVADYLEKARLYNSLDGPYQFERGFLFGAKITLWIAQQKILGPERP